MILAFIAGAMIFAIGILVGVAIMQTAYKTAKDN